MTDYLSAGPLIIARIKAKTGIEDVRPARELAGIAESAIRSPSVFVVYGGDTLGANGGRGQAQVVRQRWVVVLAVRNATQGDGGEATATEAGPLITELLESLQGWEPSTNHGPLERKQAQQPGYSPAFAYYPLAFDCQLFTIGD